MLAKEARLMCSRGLAKERDVSTNLNDRSASAGAVVKRRRPMSRSRRRTCTGEVGDEEDRSLRYIEILGRAP